MPKRASPSAEKRKPPSSESWFVVEVYAVIEPTIHPYFSDYAGVVSPLSTAARAA
jgi:hypothetical protein